MKNKNGDNIYKYEIGGKTYIQRPLVLGQIRQLLEALKGVYISGDATAAGLVAALGDNLPQALAIVLTEEGTSPRNKDLPVLAEEIEFAIELEQTLAVVEDFLDCNPLPSLLERLAGMMKKIGGMMPTGSQNSASPSRTETSPNVTESPGK